MCGNAGCFGIDPDVGSGTAERRGSFARAREVGVDTGGVNGQAFPSCFTVPI